MCSNSGRRWITGQPLYACHSSPFNQSGSALSILLTGLNRQNSETAPKITAPLLSTLYNKPLPLKAGETSEYWWDITSMITLLLISRLWNCQNYPEWAWPNQRIGEQDGAASVRHSCWSRKKMKFTEFYGCKKLNSANNLNELGRGSQPLDKCTTWSTPWFQPRETWARTQLNHTQTPDPWTLF